MTDVQGLINKLNIIDRQRGENRYVFFNANCIYNQTIVLIVYMNMGYTINIMIMLCIQFALKNTYRFYARRRSIIVQFLQ